jgi:hypothetical protein
MWHASSRSAGGKTYPSTGAHAPPSLFSLPPPPAPPAAPTPATHSSKHTAGAAKLLRPPRPPRVPTGCVRGEPLDSKRMHQCPLRRRRRLPQTNTHPSRHSPCRRGCEEPLMREPIKYDYFHGLDGLGDVPHADPAAASVDKQPEEAIAGGAAGRQAGRQAGSPAGPRPLLLPAGLCCPAAPRRPVLPCCPLLPTTALHSSCSPPPPCLCPHTDLAMGQSAQHKSPPTPRSPPPPCCSGGPAQSRPGLRGAAHAHRPG